MTTPKPSGCLTRLIRLSLGFIFILALLLLSSSLYQRIALASSRTQYPAPGELVDVAGHLMHLHCLGSGSPTVVIDAGNGSFSIEWVPIQEQLSQVAQVCTYDRAGYGWSEPGPQPRDGAQVVAELQALLQAAGETGPYVLVGHSLGGVHVRLFAAQYPQEVVGMVLVDTAAPLVISPDYELQMRSSIGFYQVMNLLTQTGILRLLGPLGGEGAMPETARKLPPTLQETYLNLLLDPAQYTTAIAEMQALPQTFEQANQSLPAGKHPLGDIPLIVLTAGQMAAPGSTPFDTQLMAVPAEQIAAQGELAKLSPQGEQRLVAQSGHLVHLDAPEAVIQAIRDIITSIER